MSACLLTRPVTGALAASRGPLGAALRQPLGPTMLKCHKRTLPLWRLPFGTRSPKAAPLDMEKLAIPEAPKPQIVKRRLAWGGKHLDPYAYLEDVQDPRTVAYLEREATFTQEMSKLTQRLQHDLTHKLDRLNTLGDEAPVRHIRVGRYEFYTRNLTNVFNPDRVDSAYYRKMVDPVSEDDYTDEVKLIDTRLLRWQGFTVGKFVMSPHPDYYAFTVRKRDETGTETAELWVQRIKRTKIETISVIPNILNFVWSADAKSVYYTVLDDRLRSCKVVVRSIEYDEENRETGKYERQRDRVIYDEANPYWFIDISRSKDDKFIIIHSGSLTSSEVHLVDATLAYNPIKNPGVFPKPFLIEPRADNVEYFVDHHEDKLFVLTNRHSPNQFQLMLTTVDKCQARHWRQWITQEPDELIEDVDIFKDFVVTYGRRRALPYVQVHCFDKSKDVRADHYEIALPEKYASIRPITNINYDTDLLKFAFSSPLTSELTVEYDMRAREVVTLDGPQLQHIDNQKYQIIRAYVPSAGDKHVPVTLVCNKAMECNGRNPTLLHAYGAYGTSMEMEFRPEMLPLLERGWIVALAHVRGGSDMGRHWYLDGKLEHKPNSIRDLIAVSEWLIGRKYTNSQKLAVTGTSAGGLVVGAAINQRPELYRAALLDVPFVDVVSTMINPDLPLTQVEYLEWGNPSESRQDYERMRSYSPYDNVPQVVHDAPSSSTIDNPLTNICRWPSIMVTAGMKDQRVLYWQTLKWAAKLRANIYNRQNLGSMDQYITNDAVSKTPPKASNTTSVSSSAADRPRHLFLRMEKSSGHFGSRKRKESKWTKAATDLAFLISELEDPADYGH
ncbi:hypothetical protein H4R34_000714 [Dimargaris verticillata]|uniref:Prolyl endopeptidase n=1 Tax=Dimargaris verticillata TaxID=2761393 RepID=A0A9W8EEF5_9FUNG|nr:hypothetical protein H4R34_000714 [Dimargaris verticillata]